MRVRLGGSSAASSAASAARLQLARAEAPRRRAGRAVLSWPVMPPASSCSRSRHRLAQLTRCVATDSPARACHSAACAAARARPAADAATFAPAVWRGAGQPLAAAALAGAYAKHGYVVADSLFSADECHAMEEELLRFQRGSLADEVPAITPLAAADSAMGREELLGRYMYIFQPHAASALVREWMVDCRLRGVLGAIVGAHLPNWDGGFKCMQSMFVTRKAGAPGSPWHQDEHPIPTRDRSLCGIWIALSDTTVDNGALWVVKDSHKPGVIYDRKPHSLPAGTVHA